MKVLKAEVMAESHSLRQFLALYLAVFENWTSTICHIVVEQG